MSIMVNAMSGLILAVVPNYISILVARTTFGFGAKGCWMASYVLSNNSLHFILNLCDTESVFVRF